MAKKLVDLNGPFLHSFCREHKNFFPQNQRNSQTKILCNENFCNKKGRFLTNHPFLLSK